MDGFQRLVINPNERAISTDHIRLQAFKGKDAAEIWRALLDTNLHTDDLDASTDGTVLGGGTTTQNTPVTAEVLNGLCVIPQVGSLVLLVQPGSAFLYDPDATPNADESQYKLANDPGVPTAGALFMTANASGSTRVDVIECARANIGGSAPDTVLEADNRDVYNTVTGLFSASTVNKVTAGRLQYRVRLGTPGAGFPGAAQGWLPLAVASVPTGTTTNDTITFWDVRPLMSDRVFQPFSLARDLPRISAKAQADGTGTFGAGHTGLTGVVEATAIDFSTTPETASRYRLGGRIRRGTPGSDSALAPATDGLDLGDATNTDGTLNNTTPVAYVYLLEPFGLPRWARYTDYTTGVRKPRSPRGIILASATPPKHFWGGPSAAISLASCGFTGQSTQKGVCFMVLPTVGAGLPSSGIADGPVGWAGTAYNSVVGTIAGGNVSYALADGTSHPAHAKAVWASLGLQVSVPNANTTLSVTVQVKNASGSLSNVAEFELPCTNSSGGAVSVGVSLMVRIPVVSGYPVATQPAGRNVLAIVTGGPTPSGLQSLQVLGWEL